MTNEEISQGVVNTHAFYGDPVTAADYVEKTQGLSVLLTPFLVAVSMGKDKPWSELRVLDAGCGSGRDAKDFEAMGLQVEAIDASPALVQKARERTKAQVYLRRFQDFCVPKPRFDGIWAQASLLHVPPEELPDVVFRLASALKPGGVLWATFKYGTEPTIDSRGRFFTNMTKAAARKLFKSCPVLEQVVCKVDSGSSSGGEQTSWVTVYGFRKP